ncbi:glutamine synthetase/guanido kinase [Ramicandelaber brevisporus]|nr:glutamine synthetase/guanido kinase [Ramicandelaber brevisporus]
MVADTFNLEELLASDNRVKVAGIDIDGLLRGKVLDKSKFLSTLQDGFGFCSVIFGWDIHDLDYNCTATSGSGENRKLTVTNVADTGYGDLIAKVDLSSMRRIPWDKHNTPFFFVDFYNPLSSEGTVNVCPRGLLKTVIERYKALGLEPMCGLEYEFYNYDETPESLAQKQGVGLQMLTPGNYGYSLTRLALNDKYSDGIWDNSQAIGAVIEGFHTESGSSVYEAALKYTTALELADRAQLFKMTAKQVGLQNGVIASFMAKPSDKLPGCSGHIHISLRDIVTKVNQFASSTTAANNTSFPGMSAMMQHFVAGVLDGLPSILAILAPNINSYKRLVSGNFVSTAANWGIEQRNTALRVIAPPVCPPSATRVEIRTAGSDINPHLAIAAVLACGMRGIQLQLDLTDADKYPQVGSPSYNANVAPKFANNLPDAANCMMEEGSVARQVLGDAFVDHYGATRLHECQLWAKTVTNRELIRYLEII